MRGDVVQKTLPAGTGRSGGIGGAQGKGITGNDHYQYQQDGHHNAGDLFNTALYAMVDNKGGDSHKEKRINDRDFGGGNEGVKIAIPGSGTGLPGEEHHSVFGDPPANDRVVGHDEHRHQEGESAQKPPAGAHFGIGANGALLGFTADGNIGGEQGKAKGKHQHQINDEEQTAAIFGGQIRESPQISHADGAAGSRQHKANLPRKMI